MFLSPQGRGESPSKSLIKASLSSTFGTRIPLSLSLSPPVSAVVHTAFSLGFWRETDTERGRRDDPYFLGPPPPTQPSLPIKSQQSPLLPAPSCLIIISSLSRNLFLISFPASSPSSPVTSTCSVAFAWRRRALTRPYSVATSSWREPSAGRPNPDSAIRVASLASSLTRSTRLWTLFSAPQRRQRAAMTRLKRRISSLS